MAAKRRRPSSTRRSESDTALLNQQQEEVSSRQVNELEGLKAEITHKVDTLKSRIKEVRILSCSGTELLIQLEALV